MWLRICHPAILTALRRGRLRVAGVALALIWTLAPPGEQVQAAPGAPTVSGRALVLADAGTGQVLFQENGALRLFPASTTKVLTALLAAQSDRLAETVTVSWQASGVEGTTCFLQNGETQSLGNLLDCLMVASGNDAAVAIAEHLSGSVGAFVERMNAEARAAGAMNSHFTNPHGLHDPDHYTTALDLAMIGRRAFQSARVHRAGSLQEFILQGPEPDPRQFRSRNLALWIAPGTMTGKIGFTEEAGHTMVAMAERSGRRLILAQLGYHDQDQMFAELRAFLDWGVTAFYPEPAVQPGLTLGQVAVAGGSQGAVAAIPRRVVEVLAAAAPNPAPPLSNEVHLLEQVDAPVYAGQYLGELRIRQAGRIIGRTELVAVEGVPGLPAIPNQVGPVGRWPITLGLLAAAAGVGVLRAASIRRRWARREGGRASMTD